MNARAIPLLTCAAAFLGCGAPQTPPPIPAPVASASSSQTETSPPRVLEPAPTLRLPTDTRPLAERLELTIDPSSDRFSGVVDLRAKLDHARDVIWLHGLGLHVTKATVTPAGGAPIAATWEEKDRTGTAGLTLSSSAPAGEVTIHVEYDAAFGSKLEGLYKVHEAGQTYAVTQFESISAREAFPCFDEPGLKIPFDTTLIAPAGLTIIANTKETERTAVGPNVKVHFAPTLPLPSYLVAFAVGPYDVVNAPDVPPNAVRKRPLPLRGVTTKGRGKDIAYAIAHTGDFVSILEAYFGIEYPYDKLDMIAVPDKGGAMENAGAITFGSNLLLFDDKTAPIHQRRNYARVVAHELAHQWVGDLVTASFWDDIWLNEAFATWIAAKAADAWDPKTQSSMDLLEGVQGAMGADAKVSARSIRQPIDSPDDIENAFDSITYEKGGGVLAMFERYLGKDVFQRGVHEHLAAHAFGAATSDDFLDAMSKASGKDVKTPFHTFLDQPGVPFIEAEVRCDGKPRLHLTQSRYLPLGSTGDAAKTWQLPVCARFQTGKDSHEACTLLTAKEGDLPLGDVCPDWVFPNADAAGYFRFSLAAKDLANLRTKGFAALSTRERIAYGNSLRAALNRATTPYADLVRASAPLADDPHLEVANESMAYLEVARDWLYEEPVRAKVEAYAAKLFRPALAKLGWDRKKSDDQDTVRLRSSVLSFLAGTAQDKAVRAEAKKRALAYLGYQKDGKLHPEAVDENLTDLVLWVAGSDADKPLFDAIYAAFVSTDDERVRRMLLWALASVRSPELSKAALALVFDPKLHVIEATSPLWGQLDQPEHREATWAWVKDHFDEIVSRISAHHGKAQLIDMGGQFCDEAHAKDVEAFFKDRVAQIEGGPRVLAGTLESIRLCAKKKEANAGQARVFFAGK